MVDLSKLSKGDKIHLRNGDVCEVISVQHFPTDILPFVVECKTNLPYKFFSYKRDGSYSTREKYSADIVKITKFKKYTLQTLPHGSVIEYRKKRYFKHKGLDGDILSTEKSGGWFFIKDTCPEGTSSVNWKKFKILFIPET